MAMKFVDSFDHYAVADMAKKWDAVPTAGHTISAGNGRFSSSSFRLTWASVTNGRISKSLGVNAPTLVAGAAFRFSGGFQGTNDFPLIAFTDAGVEQFSLRITPTGFLRVSRAGTTIVTSSAALVAGTFYYIEFKATIHNTTGIYQVRVNGAVVAGIPDATAQNTRGTGTNNFANGVLIGTTSNLSSGATGTSMDMDDFYVLDDTGVRNTDFKGDVRVECTFPTADSATIAWTPDTGTAHFSRVNEASADSATYVQATADNQIDQYDFTDLVESSGTVHCVQLVAYALKTDAAVHSLNQVIFSDSTTTEGDVTPALGTSFLFYNQILDGDHRAGPSTADWTIGHFNSAQFGVKQKP